MFSGQRAICQLNIARRVETYVVNDSTYEGPGHSRGGGVVTHLENGWTGLGLEGGASTDGQPVVEKTSTACTKSSTEYAGEYGFRDSSGIHMSRVEEGLVDTPGGHSMTGGDA